MKKKWHSAFHKYLYKTNEKKINYKTEKNMRSNENVQWGRYLKTAMTSYEHNLQASMNELCWNWEKLLWGGGGA